MNWYILMLLIICVISATSKQRPRKVWKIIACTTRIQSIFVGNVITNHSTQHLSTHKKTKHGSAEHKCDKCGQNFQYLRHLLRHQNSHKSSQFNCNLCDKIFSRADKLREHVQKEHGVEDTKALSCIHCQKTFSRRDKINVHMKYWPRRRTILVSTHP